LQNDNKFAEKIENKNFLIEKFAKKLNFNKISDQESFKTSIFYKKLHK